AARFSGGWVAGALSAPPPLRMPWLGRALLAQGGIAVALAVNYTQVRPDLNGDLILTATLVSVLLFDIVASREVSQLVSGTREGGDLSRVNDEAGRELLTP
ncbi:MAG TPA: hypothetical protein VE420_08540, partial [Gemmatimonadales bacterium]|nr:hypothetical protein [Gemmatimonadales bacterium]